MHRHGEVGRVAFRVAVGFTLVPILTSVVRNGLAKWYPTRDAALTIVYTNDVFSAHPPLHGLPASFSRTHPLDYHYLGALHMYLLALPVKLLGVSWGVLVGMGLLNTGWVLIALWAIRRRVGYRVGIVGCVVVASLVWGLGSQVLVDPTPVQSAPLAFLAFCLCAWSVADVDPKALLPFAFTANYLLLTHPKFLLVVAVVTVCVLAVWARRLQMCARHNEAIDASLSDGDIIADPVSRPHSWREHRRWFLAAAVVTVLVWVPPILQQFFGQRGNISAFVRGVTTGSGPSFHGVLDAASVASSTITTWPLWWRHSLEDPNFTIFGPDVAQSHQVVGALVVAMLVVAVVTNALRRRDATVVTGVGVAMVAWAAWVMTIMKAPGHTYNFHYLLTSWPLAAFVWLTLVLGIVRSRWIQRVVPAAAFSRGASAALVIVTVLFALLSYPLANYHASTGTSEVVLARRIRAAIKANVHGREPVLLVASRYPARAYLPTAALTFQEMGVPFRVPPGWDSLVYRHQREFQPGDPDVSRQLVITNAPIREPGYELVIRARRETFVRPVSRDVDAKMRRWEDGLRVLRISPKARLSSGQRRFVDDELARALSAARAEGRPLSDDADFMASLAQTNDTILGAIVEVPGVTTAQARNWVEDHIADPVGAWVYLAPLHSATGPSSVSR